MDDRIRKIKSKMENLCARREYCSLDIKKKICTALGEDLQYADQILDSLIKDGFVSDLRYSSAFAREKSAISGWGPIKIRYALRAKHIASEVIDEALSETDADKSRQRLDKVLTQKADSLRGDPQARLKLIRFALSRGYDYEEVEKRLRSLRLV